MQQLLHQGRALRGCDTFVALPPATPPGVTVFGKNSDRPTGEGQSIRRYPAADYTKGDVVQCTYLPIPQVTHTHAVLLSQIGEQLETNAHLLIHVSQINHT